MIKIKYALFLFFVCLGAFSQSLSIKVIDSKSELPLPNASIKVSNNVDLISNDEGFFNLSENENFDENTIIVSYLGYQTQKTSVFEIKNQNLVIKLDEAVYNLNEVSVNNKKPDPIALMFEVKNRLTSNYTSNESPSKSSLFLRESISFKPSQMNIDINKSTGFSKKQLKDVNQEIVAFCNKYKSNASKKYEDLLCDYYVGKNAKNKSITKLDVTKATIIKGEGSTASIDDLQKKGLNLLLKHLDSTKYYRVKSGLFGSKDTISLKQESKKEDKKNSNLFQTKAKLGMFLYEQKFLEKSKFDFIYNPKLYTYKYVGKTYSDDTDEAIYILEFSPLKSKAKYRGKLFISELDYAVVKCTYSLAEGEIVDGLNLKFLLGIKVQENVDNGTLLFKKSIDKNTYELQYALEENGQYFYLNRPVKFIELGKNKTERDILAFDLKLEGNMITKTELLTISKSETAQKTVENLKEKEFNFTILKQFDPKIWANYISIEPLEAMKQYKAL